MKLNKLDLSALVQLTREADLDTVVVIAKNEKRVQHKPVPLRHDEAKAADEYVVKRKQITL